MKPFSKPNFFFQAHKFVGVDNPQARDIVQEIKQAKSPEEAARIGRTRQREFPELVCLNILLTLIFADHSGKRSR